MRGLRRMEIDKDGNIVVTEYRGNKVAVFNPTTEKFTEYALPPYTYPYRANFDKNGDIWASTMSTDRVVRLDPKTGQDQSVPDAVGHQHAHGLGRQHDQPGELLGRQQPRPRAGEGRATRLTRSSAHHCSKV